MISVIITFSYPKDVGKFIVIVVHESGSTRPLNDPDPSTNLKGYVALLSKKIIFVHNLTQYMSIFGECSLLRIHDKTK